MCAVHAHIVLSLRNFDIGSCPPEAQPESLRTLITSFLFLTRRHTWNKSATLGVSETELWEILDKARPSLVDWIGSRAGGGNAGGDSMTGKELSALDAAAAHKHSCETQPLLHDIFTAGTGNKDYLTSWGYIKGVHQQGRFVTTFFELNAPGAPEPALVPITPVGERDAPVEINLQLMQVMMRGEFLMALDERIALDDDMRTIFGGDCETMQCMMSGSFEQMQHRRLESLPFELQQWAPDETLPSFAVGRAYRPDEFDAHEQWVADIFEPCRQANFQDLPKGPLNWFLHDREPLPVNAQVAYLVAKHPDYKKPWKEALVYRTHRVVHVYRIVSHGRRFFRQLEYTSNANHCYHALQPSTDERRTAWPHWGRHEAMEDDFTDLMENYEPPSHPTSLVILRRRKETDEAIECEKQRRLDKARENAARLEEVDPATLAVTQEQAQRAREMAAEKERRDADKAKRAAAARSHTAEEEALDEDEAMWAPILDLGGNDEDDEDDPMLGQQWNPLRKPPPQEVMDVIDARVTKLELALGVVSGLNDGFAAEHEDWPPVYKISQACVFYRDQPGWQLKKGGSGGSVLSTCIGWPYPATRGKVQYEIIFESFSYVANRVGWVQPSFTPTMALPFDEWPALDANSEDAAKGELREVTWPDPVVPGEELFVKIAGDRDALIIRVPSDAKAGSVGVLYVPPLAYRIPWLEKRAEEVRQRKTTGSKDQGDGKAPAAAPTAAPAAALSVESVPASAPASASASASANSSANSSDYYSSEYSSADSSAHSSDSADERSDDEGSSDKDTEYAPPPALQLHSAFAGVTLGFASCSPIPSPLPPCSTQVAIYSLRHRSCEVRRVESPVGAAQVARRDARQLGHRRQGAQGLGRRCETRLNPTTFLPPRPSSSLLLPPPSSSLFLPLPPSSSPAESRSEPSRVSSN